jgi:hypothetical protein
MATVVIVPPAFSGGWLWKAVRKQMNKSDSAWQKFHESWNRS